METTAQYWRSVWLEWSRTCVYIWPTHFRIVLRGDASMTSKMRAAGASADRQGVDLEFCARRRTAHLRSLTRMKRCKLDHSGRGDTGRRKHIGGFLLGNLHKGMNHDGIELRAATLYQTSPGVFM